MRSRKSTVLPGIDNAIKDQLDFITHKLKSGSILNKQDDKITCENLFCELFNIIRHINLRNINTEKVNYPVIDLIDEVQKLYFQITGDKSVNTKIKDIGISEKAKKYKNITILFLFWKDKVKPKNPYKNIEILFMDNLYKEVCNIVDTNQKQNIVEILALYLPKFDKEKKLQAEIQIIKSIIEAITTDNLQKEDNIIYLRPNPHDKLDKYFLAYQNYIIKEYTTLAVQFEALLKAIKQNLTSSEHNQVRLWLSSKSLQCLVQHKENGAEALKELQNIIESKIELKCPSENASRFFILYELINCDVFPLITY